MVNRIGYDSDTGTLHVEFNNHGRRGRVVTYHDVPPNVADSVLQAPSIGQALNAAVKGSFKFSYPQAKVR
jgi:hypothetical protein